MSIHFFAVIGLFILHQETCSRSVPSWHSLSNKAIVKNLLSPNLQPCESAIIDSLAITYAHCVSGLRPAELQIIANDQEVYSATGFSIHPNYDPLSLLHDVALIQINLTKKPDDSTKQPLDEIETDDIEVGVPLHGNIWDEVDIYDDLEDDITSEIMKKLGKGHLELESSE